MAISSEVNGNGRVLASKGQDIMVERMQKYVESWLKGDINKIMDWFVDDGLDYTDFGLGHHHMDKPALTQFFSYFSDVFNNGDVKINTTNVHGSGDFCVWECEFDFLIHKANPAIPYPEGERAKMYCSSSIWWNEEGKIVKNKDYSIWGNAGQEGKK